MVNRWPLRAALFLFAVSVIALLVWLTVPENEDPCADSQGDISAAVLAENPGDQDGLVNRAIIMKGACDKDREKTGQDD